MRDLDEQAELKALVSQHNHGYRTDDVYIQISLPRPDGSLAISDTNVSESIIRFLDDMIEVEDQVTFKRNFFSLADISLISTDLVNDLN